MLIINKKTNNCFIKPIKKVYNKEYNIFPSNKLKHSTEYNISNFIFKNNYNNLVDNFEYILLNTEFNLEEFELFINIDNIKNDFKKLIYNKLNL